jgi:hypothetical protein
LGFRGRRGSDHGNAAKEGKMKLKCYSLSISKICSLYRKGKLDLEPPYQRRPSWRTRQREDLLESIFNGIPIPAVILFKTNAGRKTMVFEVMDGKQRLETILHFRYGRLIKGESKLGFWLRVENRKLRIRLFYRDLRNPDKRRDYGLGVRSFMSYRIPVIEYSGELTGLVGQRIAQWEVFTKINSTGSKLTKNEIRHAYAGPLFNAASDLESAWYSKMVDTWHVFTKAEADRYQYHEMMLELCTIYLHGGISDKRLRLDEYIRSATLTNSKIKKAKKAVHNAISWAKRIMGNDRLTHSRLSKKVDFYSFIGALMELMRQRVVTKDSKYNKRAKAAVIRALNKLSMVDARVARYAFRSMPVRERRLAQYIVATREATDQLRNRQLRHDFWYGILAPCFKRKLAPKRLFGKELKNALWTAADVRFGRISCPNPDKRDDCWGRITYDQAVVDHRKAYIYGGKTSTENGQLMCRACNAAKGAKR